MIKSACLHVLIITRSDIIFAYTFRRCLTFLEVVYTAWEDLIDEACLAIFTSWRRGSSLSDWSLTPWCKTHQAHIYIDKFENTGYKYGIAHPAAAGRRRSKRVIHHCKEKDYLYDFHLGSAVLLLLIYFEESWERSILDLTLNPPDFESRLA